ncbi:MULTISPECIES: acetyl-CoA C-acyltransferase [Aquabacterium]|uniref:acetyl-CoA C-acyltransferase n=1 Tax=Aquabacterium TaxID=92793 RepID=UPI000718AE47|nr:MULTISPECIES: acetyl-CoA C-acyltransferase [Aquabacterium]MBU0916763.1 acetyl-CoA C-acyltransferase [Gammaproteobacteria bacterium]
MLDPVVILAARRTAIGSFQGQFQGLSAPMLGAAAIRAAMLDTHVHASEVDEVLMGCCLMAGVGQAPARQALLAAGLPDSVPATTLTKMCGSGMKTVMLGHDQLLAGTVGVVVAGGMESMTHAPYLLPSARGGQRLGHGQMVDHMFFDGLQDAYDGQLMGVHAEATAKELGFTRAEQDAYALASVQRAQAAVAEGLFASEIAPVTMKVKGVERTLAVDETPGQCKPEKIATLKPAFGADGTVTAASSASISDGAAALVLTRDSTARSRDWRPIARIVGHSTHAGPPGRFTTAPVGAIRRLFDLTGWTDEDVDLYEINEAFAVVTLIAMRELKLSPDKVNVRGGACAMGHPIGATGARILVTLIHALQQRGLQRGVAALCIGGGEATAMAIELL